jgi:hypothetical protein
MVADSMKHSADVTNDEIEFINERLAVAFQEVVGPSAGDSPTAWWK